MWGSDADDTLARLESRAEYVRFKSISNLGSTFAARTANAVALGLPPPTPVDDVRSALAAGERSYVVGAAMPGDPGPGYAVKTYELAQLLGLPDTLYWDEEVFGPFHDD